MRAYLAVLKDSFREALASRVLWILLALTTLVLTAVAPIGISEKPATQLRQNSIRNMSALVSKIEMQGRADELSPGKRIWSRLSDDLKTRLANRDALGGGNVRGGLTSDLLDDLNKLLGDREFYEPTAWSGINLNDETRALAERRSDSLTDAEVKRRNRLLLEAAYPAEIASGRAELSISYLVWHVTDVPLTRQEATPVIKGVMAAIMNFLVGTLGVLAAILVTAPIIPHTFEAGAIDLLLSKPISRPLLFLTKFAGGCAFILLNAAYFIVGLWLIVGLRFDIWSARLLLSIPIFLFLFAIYYAVSSAAGVFWRNAVVSIVVTILFWAACFVVGTTKTVMEQTWLNSNRLTKLVSAGDSLIGVTEQGQVQQWRATNETWEETFHAEGPSAPGPRGGPFFGPQQWTTPIYDSRGDRLLAVETAFAGGRGFGGPDPTVWTAARTDGFARKRGPSAPSGTTELFVDGQGEILAAGVQGVFRLTRNDAGESFIPIGPNPPLQLQAPLAYALNAATGEIAIRSQNTIAVLERNSDGTFSKKRESEVSGADGALLAFAGPTLLAAMEDGRVLLLDAATLKVQQEFPQNGAFTPRFAMADPNGRWFVVLSHNHTLRMFDARDGKPANFSFIGQGDISAAAFNGDRLLVTDRVNRVTSYQLDPFQTADRRAPALTPLEQVYRYVIVPIYTVFPKPGELDNVVSYLLTEQETVATGPNRNDLSQRRIELNIYGPVFSSLVCLVVVLGVTCLYVSRTDF
jgi:ABC-2 family transporter protein